MTRKKVSARRTRVPVARVTPAKQIQLFFHCRRCLDEMPPGTSPQDWAQLEAGWTEFGLQVWCRRHEMNVIHIDFEGQQHPACLFSELPASTLQ